MKKIIFLFLINFIFALNLSYMNAFRNFNKGVSLINKNPQEAQIYFTKAFNLLSNSNKYNPNVHYMLGRMYLNGWGTQKDYQKALKELLLAKKLGNRRVHCSLLKLYLKLNNKKEAKKELNYILTHKNLNCNLDENILKELK